MRRRSEVRLYIRLYPGQDDELIHWLEQFNDKPYGVKSQAVKEALLRGIGGDAPTQAHGGNVNAALDLAEMRKVVEAAVATVLTDFQSRVSDAAATAHPLEEDEELEEILDSLEAVLILED